MLAAKPKLMKWLPVIITALYSLTSVAALGDFQKRWSVAFGDSLWAGQAGRTITGRDIYDAGKTSTYAAYRQHEDWKNSSNVNKRAARLHVLAMDGSFAYQSAWFDGFVYISIFSWEQNELHFQVRGAEDVPLNGIYSLKLVGSIYQQIGFTPINASASSGPGFDSAPGIAALAEARDGTTPLIEYWSPEPIQPPVRPMLKIKMERNQTADLTWPSEEGVLYQLQWSDNLTDWTSSEVIVGSGEDVTRTVRTDDSVKFFRVVESAG